MPKELRQNVFVPEEGKWYGPDYGNATPPSDVAERITNEAAYQDPSGDTLDLRFREDDFAGSDDFGKGVPNLATLTQEAAGRGEPVVPTALPPSGADDDEPRRARSADKRGR